jgi:hypothetical protein
MDPGQQQNTQNRENKSQRKSAENESCDFLSFESWGDKKSPDVDCRLKRKVPILSWTHSIRKIEILKKKKSKETILKQKQKIPFQILNIQSRIV